MAGELATVNNAGGLAEAGHSAAASPAVRYGRPLIDTATLVEEGQQRQLLMRYVQAHMLEGTDFGVIPGTKNRTLLKPGAEKLTDLFRCTPVFEIIERVEDWDRPLIHYVFRCRIVSRETAQVVAEGFGSCNTREAKYRWRTAERKCPKCGKAAIIRGKEEFGGGFLCFKKKDGCGAKFDGNDAAITGQVVGRAENPDVADHANTVLKMAKKRAHVDAAIALARCSDMFTQDAEDIEQDTPPAVVAPTKAEFAALMASKGWEWQHVLKALDHTRKTQFVAARTPFEQVPAALIADFAAWLRNEPDVATAEATA